jgi:site-specific DNA recombinase
MADFATIGLRAAIYARVSTEEQREGQTIDSQIAELERFAADRNLHVIGIYKDEGWSGGVMARPELDHLRDDAQRAVFQAVLINDVDRLARDVTHLGVIKRDLERHGIQVVFRKLPAENSPTHNLMINILGSFAEFERELIADRTRRGRKHKVTVRKQYLGGLTAYGYRYIPMEQAAGRAGLLEILPEEASVVRQMFDWVDREGLSARKVLNRLNERKIPPRKGASSWAKSSVLRVLRREMYAGVWYYNKHEAYEPERSSTDHKYRKHVKSGIRRRKRDEWLPLELPASLMIVPRDQWERVQRQLNQNISFSPRNEKHAYLLKGLVRCGRCGSAYVGDPGRGRHFSYRCTARQNHCPSISESILNDAVWDSVEQALLNPDLILKHVQLFEEQDDAAIKEGCERQLHVKRSLAALEAEERRLIEAYRLSVLSAAQLGNELEKLNVRKAGLENERATLDISQPSSQENVGKSIRDYCEEVAQNLASFTVEERQQLLRTLVRTITFDGAEVRIRGEIPLPPSDSSFPVPMPAQGSPSSNEIANTMTRQRDRNPASIANTTIGHYGHNPAKGCEFELKAKIPPISQICFIDQRGQLCGYESKGARRKRFIRPRYHAA